MSKTLRLILGDQLNITHSWFNEVDESITYCIFEMRQETDYVPHHIQKVVGFFSAMREFSGQLKEKGHKTIYYRLDDTDNKQDLALNLNQIINQEKVDFFEYQLPDEYRLDQQLEQFCANSNIDTKSVDSEHFYTTRNDLANHFEGKKQWLMENFYRKMRQKHEILMDGKNPTGGKWNYDASNRKKLPQKHRPTAPLIFDRDVSELVNLINDTGVKTIGNIDPKHFVWPVNRAESLELLDYFLENCLSLFGDFQDAMAVNEWSVYHSRISFSLNTKMISTKEVIDLSIKYYEKNKDRIDISQIEGFVRQIIGWREYMRGMYWAKMPAFASKNELNHSNKLPAFYWTGKTKMNCLKSAINQSLEYAYAHHIQRLMITGNFALLANVKPEEVDEWYLGIYIDAIEWVELPNTRGMSQYADGGVIATKPYISSANYIDKMSNYCGSCYYDKKKKTGEKSCPFNSLYWNFISRHEAYLSSNPRMGMMLNLWRKMDGESQATLLEQADYYLNHLNEL
jgi:deoxyribodipyrimidine photolyase-related protein